LVGRPATEVIRLEDFGFEAIEPEGRLAQLAAYWRHLVPAGLPGRRHVDPVGIGPTLLPHVFLADVLDGGARFRWRLIGTHIVSHAGTDDTGQELEATIAPQMRETIIGQYREVVLGRRPLCHRSEFVGRDRRIYRYERLLLPLASDGKAVDMIFGGAVFGPPRAP
jgi:hypothetical protein